jgi:arylsulfatase A-like enzyme
MATRFDGVINADIRDSVPDTRNSMACITEAASGFPNASGTIPPENGMISEILGEQGWNTYIVGKWSYAASTTTPSTSSRRSWTASAWTPPK